MKMTCKRDILTFEDAQKEAKSYPYVLAYMLESVVMGETDKLYETIMSETYTKARFFDSDRELHIFSYNGSIRAVRTQSIPSDEEDCIVKAYKLAKKYGGEEKTLLVKEYLNYDSDGQAYVEQTCLAGIGRADI